MEPLFDVRGKRVLITGGSRGIGLMIATGFVEAGASVLIASRKASVCLEVAEGLSKLGDCVGVGVDLSAAAGVQLLSDKTEELWDGRLDVLVNNAGAVWAEPLETFSEAGWDKVVDINLKSLFFLTQKTLPLLQAAATRADPARIINIASVDGIRPPQVETYSYSASKAAVIALTRHLAKRLVDGFINVNAIAPGLFPSKMTESLMGDEAVLEAIPQRRAGTAEDMAGTAIFLASRASRYVTGQVVAVDGGITGLG
ncbi:MAG: SDR family oxidoreductase [Acidimicrobiia bacterium]|nr:SDR family oxidoreductase [Acidimicrobiia bacterium]MDH5422136.1 SDR family oxidoreductase [Acidimicrobiia bacterium]MDH5503788.1 SDR family oxidoreductase [Acidimicrobiia bacterium]